MANPINGISGAGRAVNRTLDTAQSILAANRSGKAINMVGVANDIAKLSVKDPKAAANALEALKKQLSPMQQGELARALPDAISAQQRAVAKVPDGLTPAQKELALDVTQLGLDIVGIFEPTPFADITSGLISAFRGDWLGAGISTLSLVPYIGDAAKLGKLGKMAKTVATAIEVAKTDSKFAKVLRPMMENLGGALDKVPGGLLDKLPTSARKQIVEMHARVDGFLKNRDVTILDGGSKGAWNKILNKPLKANADYLVNGYMYKTDKLGRVASVEGKIDLTVAARNGYQQAKVGKAGNTGDQGGHLIASIFNGAGEKLNMVPMNGNFNMGAWKVMENKLAAAASAGKKVEVKIEVQYGAAGGRPDGFLVRYAIDGGREVIKAFKNNPGGI